MFVKIVLIVNLIGRLGCFFFSFCYKRVIMGVNNKINNGLMVWKIVLLKCVF